MPPGKDAPTRRFVSNDAAPLPFSAMEFFAQVPAGNHNSSAAPKTMR